MHGIESLEEIQKIFHPSRFAVLHHVFPSNAKRASHWDLLLEKMGSESDSLITFEISNPPVNWTMQTVVTRLPDHRPIYLTYQGPVSTDRGFVHRVMDGTIEWLEFTEDRFVLRLIGKRWPGDASNNPVRPFSALLEIFRISPALDTEQHWHMTLSELAVPS